jgi:hypothetical protein
MPRNLVIQFAHWAPGEPAPQYHFKDGAWVHLSGAAVPWLWLPDVFTGYAPDYLEAQVLMVLASKRWRIILDPGAPPEQDLPPDVVQ